MHIRRFGVALATVVAFAGSIPSVSAATAHGYDVSYPQCGSTLPSTGVAFAIVGVTGGKPFSANACLSSELQWAYAHDATAGFYLNTANPGPRVSTHWPVGQSTPQACATTYPADDSAGCAYDYGWNFAADAFAQATAATTNDPTLSAWWLDVETTNSWETLEYGATTGYESNDQAALHGAADYLMTAKAIRNVGYYSTKYQWGQIAGDPGTAFASFPSWVAGSNGLKQAIAHCGSSYSFTGGPVQLTQYHANGLDADYRC